MIRIDHVGIAVKDLERASETYARLLGKPSYKTETVASEAVETAFFACGQTKVELLEAKSAESAIARFIAKRGEGIHHIAFEV
ncbi:MAG TPA: VOC family protein, partial [Anseongella sp.]|nr:VOC family protein [Anseongella sp.]